jgi:hypothetical protein
LRRLFAERIADETEEGLHYRRMTKRPYSPSSLARHSYMAAFGIGDRVCICWNSDAATVVPEANVPVYCPIPLQSGVVVCMHPMPPLDDVLRSRDAAADSGIAFSALFADVLYAPWMDTGRGTYCCIHVDNAAVIKGTVVSGIRHTKMFCPTHESLPALCQQHTDTRVDSRWPMQCLYQIPCGLQ